MADAVSVERVTVDRGGRTVVDDVSLALAPGDIVAVVGPNGAGKSSLLEATLGLLPLASGRVTFGGQPLRDLETRARVFSYMPDEAEPPPEVGIEMLVAHAERFGQPPPGLAADLIAQLGLQRLLGERAGRLSCGQKRRLLLFTALCTSRPVVVLDEPLATFDPLQLLDVLPVLRNRAAAGVVYQGDCPGGDLQLSVRFYPEAGRIDARRADGEPNVAHPRGHRARARSVGRARRPGAPEARARCAAGRPLRSLVEGGLPGAVRRLHRRHAEVTRHRSGIPASMPPLGNDPARCGIMTYS